MDSTLSTIIEIIANNGTGISAEDITEETNLIDDLNVSSLESLSIISDIEDEFDIELSNKEVRKLLTVQDIVDIVNSKF